MIFSRQSCLLLVLLSSLLMLFTACGGSDWADLTKVGNTWEYEGALSGAKVTAKVLGTWKVGDKVYAEVAPNFAVYSNVSRICAWDDKNKEFLQVGEASLFADGTKQLFVENRVLGAMKGSNTSFTNTDGTVIRYIGEEKIKVPAGEFSTFKFTHLNEDRKVDMYVWYASKRGVVRLTSRGETWSLTKFTEGKSADPKDLGGANAAKITTFVQYFFSAAQTGDVAALQRFFAAGDGQQDYERQKGTALAAYTKRASALQADQVTYAFLGGDSVNIRFMQFDESGVTPTVVRTDAVLELAPEGNDMRAKKINIATANMY